MDIDANGIVRVEAEETRSGVKASYMITSDNTKSMCAKNLLFDIAIRHYLNLSLYIYIGSSKDEIERHIIFVESDPTFAAKSG